MRTFIITVLFTFPLTALFCQSKNLETINSSGTTLSTQNGSISYSLGQLSSETLENQDVVFSQGYQQSTISVVSFLTEQQQENLSLSIYPNPTSEALTISSSNEKFDFEILDINGKVIYQSKKSALTHKVNVSEYANGNYIILINSQQTYQIIKK